MTTLTVKKSNPEPVPAKMMVRGVAYIVGHPHDNMYRGGLAYLHEGNVGVFSTDGTFRVFSVNSWPQYTFTPVKNVQITVEV